MSFSLPDGSGVEVLKQIRRRGWDLCVVLLTSTIPMRVAAKCQQLGARGGL